MREPEAALDDRGDLVGDHDAAVPSPGAADTDREVRLALAHVGGQQQREHRLQLVEERRGLRLAEHEAAHLGIGTRERPQRLDPMGVREEATVEEEVDVHGDAVLVAERHEVGLEIARLRPPRAEELPNPFTELMDVEIAGVDDDVRLSLQLLEEITLQADAVEDAAGVGQWMASP